MRLLQFNVNAQTISKDPECDFSNLVSGTSGYLKAKFKFSEEWDNCIKIARFFRGNNEYATCLDCNNECDIPEEALVGATFRVSVLGQNNNYRINSNSLSVRQEVVK